MFKLYSVSSKLSTTDTHFHGFPSWRQQWEQLRITPEHAFHSATYHAKKLWVLTTAHYRLCLEAYSPLFIFTRALTLQNTKDPRASLKRKHAKCLKGPRPFVGTSPPLLNPSPSKTTLDSSWEIQTKMWHWKTLLHSILPPPVNSETRDAAAASLCDLERRALIYKGDGNSLQIETDRKRQERWGRWSKGHRGCHLSVLPAHLLRNRFSVWNFPPLATVVEKR